MGYRSNEIIRDPNEPLTPCRMKDGKCSCCGECCCSILNITKREQEVLTQWIKDHRYYNPFERTKGIPTCVDLMCPFLTADRKCACYDVRPSICKIYHCGMTYVERQQAHIAEIGVQKLDMINMWTLFGQTGLRQNGINLPYMRNMYVTAKMRDGQTYKFTPGEVIPYLVTTQGQWCCALIIGASRTDVVVIVDRQSHAIKFGDILYIS